MSNLMILAAAIPGLLFPTAAPPAAVPTLETSAAATPSTPARADSRRYCIVETPTGSRLSRRKCQTHAEWERDGVDIDAK